MVIRVGLQDGHVLNFDSVNWNVYNISVNCEFVCVTYGNLNTICSLCVFYIYCVYFFCCLLPNNFVNKAEYNFKCTQKMNVIAKISCHL